MTAVATPRYANSSVTGAISTTESSIVSSSGSVVTVKLSVFAAPFRPRLSSRTEIRLAGMFMTMQTNTPASTSRIPFSAPVFSTSTVSRRRRLPTARNSA